MLLRYSRQLDTAYMNHSLPGPVYRLYLRKLGQLGQGPVTI